MTLEFGVVKMDAVSFTGSTLLTINAGTCCAEVVIFILKKINTLDGWDSNPQSPAP